MNRPPEKALVLAAGYGTRLRPLTAQVPKPLLPLWGRPMIEHVLARLRAWGVREVLVNLHHGADALLEWARRRRADGLRISLSFEPDILGTSGALRRGAWFFDAAPFWVVNADIAAELPRDPFLRALRHPRTLAAVWLHATRGPRTVEMEDGRIECFRSHRPGTPGTFTFCGLQLVRPEALRYVPETGFATLVHVYEAAQADGWRIAGVACPRAYWADIGTPAQYLAAHREVREAARRHAPGHTLASAEALRRERALRRAGVHIAGFASVGPHAVVERDARLEDAVVCDGGRVTRRADVRQAVVGPGALARGPAGHLVVPARTAITSFENDALADLRRPVGDLTAIVLEPRGSDRSFVRLEGAEWTGMLIRYGHERPENERYAGHARFLRRLGLRVPRVQAEDRERRFLIMEDFGTDDLQAAVRAAGPRGASALYRPVIAQVARWHVRGTAEAARLRLGLEEPFAPPLYDREHRLFTEHYLRRRRDRSASEVGAVLRELQSVSEPLVRAPPVLVHRDLQSSNILLTAGGPGFIDFQGMRLGPAMYDLASLLCDPYVELPEPVQTGLLAAYVRRVGARTARPDLFWLAAVQRLTQALGAYARLGALPGAERFLRHIPPALRMLRRALAHAPLALPVLAELAEAGCRSES